LKVDNQPIAAGGFAANYWGAVYQVGEWVDATLAARTVTCEIYVADTYGSVYASDSAQVPPRIPQDLKSVPSDSFTYTAPGDYLRVRTWQVWDNYDLPWNYGNMPVNESYTIGSNGCNIQIATSTASTNSEGRFEDRYGNFDGNHTIPACAIPQHQQCITESTQTISVAGYPFSHGVT
jgi:hypothetical protein